MIHATQGNLCDNPTQQMSQDEALPCTPDVRLQDQVPVMLKILDEWVKIKNVDKQLSKKFKPPRLVPHILKIYFEEIDSQYHKYFRAVLLSAPPQVYTYQLTTRHN